MANKPLQNVRFVKKICWEWICPICKRKHNEVFTAEFYNYITCIPCAIRYKPFTKESE